MEIEAKKVAGEFQFVQFSLGTFLHACFTSKIAIMKISTAVGRGFLIELFIFSQNRDTSRNSNHH